MTKAVRRLAVLSGVAILVSACEGRPSFPTPIAGVAPPPPSATYVLSGTVSELRPGGAVPIEGARVTDMMSGRVTQSDAGGRYTFDGLTAMTRTVAVTMDGYVTGRGTVTMSGDTELHIRLERIVSYVLSGVVFEMTAAGQVPVEGVELYCDSCGSPVGHTFVYTDAAGAYRFEWSQNGVHPLYVTKAGYDILDPTGTLRDSYGRIRATVQGDTRFDVQLVRR